MAVGVERVTPVAVEVGYPSPSQLVIVAEASNVGMSLMLETESKCSRTTITGKLGSGEDWCLYEWIDSWQRPRMESLIAVFVGCQDYLRGLRVTLFRANGSVRLDTGHAPSKLNRLFLCSNIICTKV